MALAGQGSFTFFSAMTLFATQRTDDFRLDVSLDTGLRALVMSDGHLKAWAPSPRRLAVNRQHETTANEAP